MQKKNPLIRSVGQLFTNAICPKVLRQLGFLSSAAIIILMVVSPPSTLHPPPPHPIHLSDHQPFAPRQVRGPWKALLFCGSVVHSVIVNMLGCCVVSHPLKYDFCGGSCFPKTWTIRQTDRQAEL